MSIVFRLHCLNRDLTNLSLYQYRDWQGYLVTGQHSGTHWIKWMLSHAIAEDYGVEPPRFYNNSSSNEVIGHPKHRRDNPDLPRIASSHSIPAYPVQWGWARALAPLPPYGVVIRDIRDVLISNYEKWKERYDVSFPDYVLGDPTGKRFVCDVWWYIRFLNRWGEVVRRYPDQTLVLRYEDFRTDTRGSLERLSRHLGLSLSDNALSVGVASGAKDVMAGRHDPRVATRGVRADGAGDTAFDDLATERLRVILREHLRHDFGYNYFS